MTTGGINAGLDSDQAEPLAAFVAGLEEGAKGLRGMADKFDAFAECLKSVGQQVPIDLDPIPVDSRLTGFGRSLQHAGWDYPFAMPRATGLPEGDWR